MTDREIGLLKSSESMTSERSNSGLSGGQATFGKTTAHPIGHRDSEALAPKYRITDSRSANMDSLAWRNGLFFNVALLPYRSIVRQIPASQETRPPFTSRQTMPSLGTITTKSISPYGPLAPPRQPQRVQHDPTFRGRVALKQTKNTLFGATDPFFVDMSRDHLRHGMILFRTPYRRPIEVD